MESPTPLADGGAVVKADLQPRRHFGADLAASTLIVLVTLFAYWPAMHGAVLWDDEAHLTRPDLQSWTGLWRIFSEVGVTQEYYPVLHGAFWAEHRLWGDNLFAYHLLNVLLHAGSACLLAFVLRQLWRRPGNRPPVVPGGTEWLAALLFALHPVAVESVAWITEQKNTLSLFLYLVAALLYLAYLESQTVIRYALALGVFFFALGAKTETVTLPAALLVVAWWRHGRVEFKRDLRPLVPWFALSLLGGIVTIFVETKLVGAEGASYVLTLGQRALLAGRIVWFYLAKLIWPHELLFYYPRWNVAAQAASWWPYSLGAILLSVGLWFARRRLRGALAAWLLFLGALFPVLGFFNIFAFVFSYVADHFQYLPCLTFAGAAAGAAGLAMNRLVERDRWIVRIGWLAAVGACAVQTNRLSARYVNDETLFSSVIARNPQSWMAHEVRASAYARAGRIQDAISEYREVVRLNPAYPNAHDGLALQLIKLPGRHEEAIHEYEEAIRLRPHYAEAHYNLALALSSDPTRRDETIMHLRVAVGLKPYFVEAQVALGTELMKNPATQSEAMGHFAYAEQIRPDLAIVHLGYADALATMAGRQGEAVEEYRRALRLAPNDVRAHFNLANTLAMNRPTLDDAVAEFQAALRLNPNAADIHANLGTALLNLRRPREALAEYERAVALDPQLVAAHESLAFLLSQIPGRQGEAIDHAETAAKLQPENPDLQNNLGTLYAQSGNLRAAERAWRAALAIDPNFTNARQNLERLEAIRQP